MRTADLHRSWAPCQKQGPADQGIQQTGCKSNFQLGWARPALGLSGGGGTCSLYEVTTGPTRPPWQYRPLLPTWHHLPGPHDSKPPKIPHLPLHSFLEQHQTRSGLGRAKSHAGGPGPSGAPVAPPLALRCGPKGDAGTCTAYAHVMRGQVANPLT